MYLVHQFISSTLWNWYELVVNLWATTIFWRRGLQISPSPWRCCSKACASWCLWSSWSESRQQLDLKPNHTTRVIRSPRFTNIKTENGWCGMIGMLWITTLLQHARPASNGQAQTRTCRCSSQIRAFSSQAMPITKPHKVAVGFFVCSKVHTQPSTIQQTNLIEDLTVPVAATNNIRLCPQQIPCARPHLLKHFQLFAVSCLLVLPLKGKHRWGWTYHQDAAENHGGSSWIVSHFLQMQTLPSWKKYSRSFFFNTKSCWWTRSFCSSCSIWNCQPFKAQK